MKGYSITTTCRKAELIGWSDSRVVLLGPFPIPEVLNRILIVDDEPDVTLTFSVGLECYYHYQDNETIRFETYNDPVIALSEFKPNLYDCS